MTFGWVLSPQGKEEGTGGLWSRQLLAVLLGGPRDCGGVPGSKHLESPCSSCSGRSSTVPPQLVARGRCPGVGLYTKPGQQRGMA